MYKLRYEGLDRRLTNDELAQVLLHIAKHRGFKSTSKAADGADSDTGEVKKGISANKTLMQEKRYRTVGEMIYLDEKFRTDCPWNENGYILTPRNKSGDYKHTVLRDMLADEVMKIFKELIEKEEVTIVMTTHDMGLLDIADCIYHLEDGEIVDEK